jgi:hypothetical protein
VLGKGVSSVSVVVQTRHHAVHPACRPGSPNQGSTRLSACSRSLSGDHDEFVIVGVTRGASRREWDVVVVQDAQRAVVEDDHILDRDEWETERVPRPGEPTRVCEVEQVGDEGLVQRSIVIAVAPIGQTDLLDKCCVALPAVAFDDEELVPVDGDRILDRIIGRVQPLDPARARVRPRGRVELVQPQRPAPSETTARPVATAKRRRSRFIVPPIGIEPCLMRRWNVGPEGEPRLTSRTALLSHRR